jgi:ankyrin repeat protein
MLRKSLATLPPTLDQTYERILSAISKEDSKYAIRILRWVTFSARPLSIDEVAEVVAIDIEQDPVFDRDEVLEDPLEILNICSSLVTITVNERDVFQGSPRHVVALAHYSVKEYLVSDRIWKGDAAQYGMQDDRCHDAIASGCLGYLLQFQQPELAFNNHHEIFKLALYSARFWISHAKRIGDRGKSTIQVAIRLFSTENPAYFNWAWLYDPNIRRVRAETPHPLYYAALSGLSKIVELLLDRGADPNTAQGGGLGSALYAASLQGHVQVVNLLLNKDADPNESMGCYHSPLYTASLEGHEQVVQLLLNKGADPNVQDGEDPNPLYAAVEQGHEQVVNLLLDKGANPNTQVKYYHNPIYTAAEGGNKQVVKLLLDKGADPNVEGGEYGSALQAASHRGHDQVVKLLINEGADVNVQFGHYGSPLYTASERGHEKVVRLLLDKGADPNVEDGYYVGPLQAALKQGHEQVVKLLLDKGARLPSKEETSATG